MTKEPRGRLILVGRVAGAFGVRGEVRIATFTADPLSLLAYAHLLREDGSPALTLTGARPGRSGEIVARCPELAHKEAADALKGLRLFVRREALPAVDDEDDFYQADLIGLTAFDPAGVSIGRLKAVHDFGAGDVLEIDPGGGRPTWLVAFTRETAPTIDVRAGRIVVVRPAEIEPEPADRTPDEA